MSAARSWLIAARPATLLAAVSPVIVGAAAAHGSGAFRTAPVVAALLGAILLQIGANFANDVFDHEKGADTAERIGPVRAVSAGLLTATQVRRGMVLVFALATAIGVYLTAVTGPWIVAVGIASILCAIAYTGGPYPLGYHGLGDVFVFLFFGPVPVCGTVYVALGHVPAVAWVACIPAGTLTTNILVVNNVRDVATDTAAGKRTVVVRFGRRFGVGEYVAMAAIAYAVPVALLVGGRAGPLVLLPLLTLPLAVALTRTIATRVDGPTLNRALARTAMLLFVHSVLFAIGLVFSALPAP